MKLSVTFDSWEEMELFRTSGKKTRSKKEEAEDSAVATQSEPQVFSPPVATPPVSGGFPGANGPTPAPTNPVVTAILARIDGAISSGQPAETIINWFRQQIGPDAKDATLDQIKQVFIPRMTKAQLEQLAPQLGISAQ